MASKTIINADFSYQKMLTLDPKEARKYFLLNMFLPVAYQMANPSEDSPIIYIGLMIYRKVDLYKPVFLYGYEDSGRCFFDSHHIPNNLTPDSAILEGDYIRFLDNLGKTIDFQEQSRAIKLAFSNCFGNKPCDYTDSCPLVSVFKATNTGASLNVVCKTTESVPRQEMLYDRCCTRADTFTKSTKYENRIYNRLTGEWIGLCDPSDENCCQRCKKIFSSVAADNIYNDPEVL